MPFSLCDCLAYLFRYVKISRLKHAGTDLVSTAMC